jgi:hypothetical protein
MPAPEMVYVRPPANEGVSPELLDEAVTELVRNTLLDPEYRSTTIPLMVVEKRIFGTAFSEADAAGTPLGKLAVSVVLVHETTSK